jgi:hypothetical protein
VPIRPVSLDDSIIGQPLDWNLYTVSGVLVASAGMTVADQTQLARLTARPLYRKVDPGMPGANLADRLRYVMQEYPLMLKAAGTPTLELGIRDLASELTALARLDHDACLGLLRRLPMRDPAARHCLLTALIALDLADQINLPDAVKASATAAAMTMNISAMRLHAELNNGSLQFSPEIRAEMRRHPEASAGLLETSGIDDPIWLDAVRQHHEHLDGSGYPLGLRNDEIGISGRLIRVADFYAAKISGRHYRAPKAPKFVFKHLFGNERGRLDGYYSVLLPRLLGVYPPGTLVRLATRETAVVTRKEGSGETAGRVTAFMDVRGRVMKEAVERNTTQVNYTVLGVTEAEYNWPDIPWASYWGY